MQLESGAFIKHYEIIRPLGEGGMGQVFLARDTRLGRLVAIKVLTFADATANAQFLSEARATARCKHENIVVIYEADEFDSVPYMVLEYVDGLTLRAWMDQNSAPVNAATSNETSPDREPIAPAMCVELMYPVARALASAHELGIVHRDLKPENILVSKDGPVKVVDFGIAAWLDGEERPWDAPDDSAGASGTLPYVSPEALLNDAPDHRVDIWAFGIILFELAMGRHPLAPFTMHRISEVMDVDKPMPSVRALSPELGGFGTLIDRCLEKRKDARIESAKELVGELAALRAGIAVPLLLDSANPFAGLMAFQEADQAKFFGRDRDIASLLARVRFLPLVAVGGPSGAGKSSFVRAGLIPAYKRLGEKREAIVLRPGKKPLLALASALAEIADKTLRDFQQSSLDVTAGPEALAGILRERPGLFGAMLRASCRARGPHAGTLLFVDQFEEIFTICPDPVERAAFLSCVEGAADDATSPLRVILALRSDFLDRMADDRKLSADLSRGLFLLPPLGKDGLHEALTKPLEALGYRYDTTDLVDRMLAALDKTNAPLPLLQFTASKLWEARDIQQRLLTKASYERLGGVEGTLAGHADTVVASMPARDKALARRFFERLVTPERTRAIASETDLHDLSTDPIETERVLSRLVEARLLVAEKDESSGGVTVEIVHESLIARWPMLSRWLDENKEDADFLARLRVVARQWRESGKPRGLLWRDEALLEARRFRERSRVELSRTEQEFLEAVFALGQTITRRRRFVVLVVVAASFVIAVAMGTLAWKERQASREATAQAARAQDLAQRTGREAARARDAARIASARDHEDDPTFALSLLREIEEPAESRGFGWLAARAARKTIAQAVLPGHDGQVWTAELSPDGRHALTSALDFAYVWDTRGFGPPIVLRGHTAPVYRATYSPDGRRILTASWDKTARIWPADGGPPVILTHDARVSWAAWSPDGKRVVTAGWDPAAYVFQSDGSGEPLVLRGHEQRLRRASFSSDGTRVVTASFDDTARVWHLDGSTPPIVLSGHVDNVMDAVFSPDGRRVATASADGTARVFFADGSGKPRVLLGHTKSVNSVAWSPDGKRLATASQDETVRVWHVDDDNAQPIVLKHGGALRFVTFSPDGRVLLTSSADNVARLWTVGALDTMTELAGHKLGVESASFSADGQRFITASGDGTARIWSTQQKNAPLVFPGPPNVFIDIDLDPTGRRMLLIWPGQNTARIWDVHGLSDPHVLKDVGTTFIAGNWSRDGRMVLTTHEDGTVRIWPADGSGNPKVLPAKGKVSDRGVFSPDGSRVAIGYEDGAVAVFRIDGPTEPFFVTHVSANLVDFFFTPDAKRLFFLGREETFVRIWNVETGAASTLDGHANDVHEAVSSPDGQRILTVSADNTARISRIDGVGDPVVLRGHTHKLVSGDFSPDGKRVVTASADGTLRIWNADGFGDPLVLRESQDTPRHVKWSPDGSRILSASELTLHVWNADGSGIPRVLEGHTGRIHQIHWSPDGTYVVSSSIDGTVRVWSNVGTAPTLEALSEELWRASAFCMSIEQRRDILGVTEEMARLSWTHCYQKVIYLLEKK
jgi:WD40 repeat protein